MNPRYGDTVYSISSAASSASRAPLRYRHRQTNEPCGSLVARHLSFLPDKWHPLHTRVSRCPILTAVAPAVGFGYCGILCGLPTRSIYPRSIRNGAPVSHNPGDRLLHGHRVYGRVAEPVVLPVFAAEWRRDPHARQAGRHRVLPQLRPQSDPSRSDADLEHQPDTFATSADRHGHGSRRQPASQTPCRVDSRRPRQHYRSR